MSGHSKWATIKRQKGVNDAKRGALFTKLGNQIAISARAGTDPASNSALAMAIEKAKAANMPNDNIQRSIQRSADKSAAQLEEVMYEGYGPGGVAILVECATDNRNRTLPEVRTAFTKNGGNIAGEGSVAFQFSRKGLIRVKGTDEETELKAIDAGADDVYAEPETDETVIYTAPNELAKVREELKSADAEVVDAELTFEPNNTVEINDVTNTHTNFEITEGIRV
jgi:YebC/PmpR family DNA-binding regulatory protein